MLVPSKTEAFKFKALHLNEPCLKSAFSVSECALLSHPDGTEAQSLSYRQVLWSACCVLAGTEQCAVRTLTGGAFDPAGLCRSVHVTTERSREARCQLAFGFSESQKQL